MLPGGIQLKSVMWWTSDRIVARAYGMVRLAKETGLTWEGLYKTLSKDGTPSFSSILKVIRALGLKLKPEAA